jgi:hypothetical protein
MHSPFGKAKTLVKPQYVAEYTAPLMRSSLPPRLLYCHAEDRSHIDSTEP